MDRLELARSIERSSYRSWKARECVEYDGWQLRYADGFSRRGNSVYPEAGSTLPHGEKLEWCRRWYKQRGLGLVVRQTIASESGLDTVLEAGGFTAEGRTDVLVGPVRPQVAQLEVDPAPTLAWWNTTSALWGFDLANSDGWSSIINRIDLPAGFVCVDGEAAGLAIADGRWMGLFEIVVAPQVRRTGLGGAVTRSLVEWGRARGATQAYLQVVAENRTAIEFYDHLGFERAYTYWYRRDQLRPENNPA